jgi:hypothetical protein
VSKPRATALGAERKSVQGLGDQRAAARIRHLSESLDEMVRAEEDVTQFSGIGET